MDRSSLLWCCEDHRPEDVTLRLATLSASPDSGSKPVLQHLVSILSAYSVLSDGDIVSPWQYSHEGRFRAF